MGERRIAYRIFFGVLKAEDQLEITGKYVGKIKVSLIQKARSLSGLIWLRIGRSSKLL